MPQKKNATSNDSVSNIETDSLDLQKLSQKIKAERSSKGWDLNQLFKVTNIPIATILEYESGNIETLDMNIISNLERVLGKFTIEKKNTNKTKHLNKKRQEKKKAKAEREHLFQSSRHNLGFNAFNN